MVLRPVYFTGSRNTMVPGFLVEYATFNRFWYLLLVERTENVVMHGQQLGMLMKMELQVLPSLRIQFDEHTDVYMQTHRRTDINLFMMKNLDMYVPHALVVKDGLIANVPTATPVPTITFFTSSLEQSTVFAISIMKHSLPLLWACLIHGSQILPDITQGFAAGRKSPPPMKEQEQALLAALTE
ncbi:hypothetical protein ARMGADRAFT_1039387 [Armillaria gallica]|uniref:Uncharacterized protein n=1 Tax=Armillaria gallica TaxID=47427 RepID=A0A2H3CX29_ARMGA|nr:hypothetical protein ARMGADRAFT_1039387 [Armillaria gallica]